MNRFKARTLTATNINEIQDTFLLEPGELSVLFTDLTAVILCEPPTRYFTPKLKFLHASLPDFLIDETRSEQYHIDLNKYRTDLLCRFLERLPPILDPLWSKNDSEAAIDREWNRLQAIVKLLEKAKASERLYSALMNFNCTFYRTTLLNTVGKSIIVPNIIQSLKGLDFSDQGEAYCHVIDIFAAEYAKDWPVFPDYAKKFVEDLSPDLMPVWSKFRSK